MTAPNGPSQMECIRKALAQARVKPEQVTYIEAHGTGTPLGDPIEVSALQGVIGNRSPDAPPCHMASVKGNIGHLETASGVASLIKVVLMLQHGQIPPQRNFKDAQSEHRATRPDAEDSDRTYARGQTAIGRGIAGISGFGFGGTNAHVDRRRLAATAARREPAQFERPFHLATFSAANSPDVREDARRHARRASTRTSRVADRRRLPHAHDRSHAPCPNGCAFPVERRRNSPSNSSSSPKRASSPARRSARPRRGVRPKIGFLFTGQGSQYAGMARELVRNAARVPPRARRLRSRSSARCCRRRCCRCCTTRRSIRRSSIKRPTRSRRCSRSNTRSARLWESWGLRPDVVMGTASASSRGGDRRRDVARRRLEAHRRTRSPHSGTAVARHDGRDHHDRRSRARSDRAVRRASSRSPPSTPRSRSSSPATKTPCTK